MQDAAQVAQRLREISALLRFSEEPAFKRQAYETAAEVVTTVGDELGSVVEQDKLRSLQGIGPSLERQIKELWNTGSSEYLERLRAALPEGAAELVQIPGMTPKRIRALSEALGIRSISDLLSACAAGRVRNVPGFGQKTEERLCAACENWLKREPNAPPRLLLSDALALAASLERSLRDDNARVFLSGAARRGEETVTELEFVVDGDVRAALERLSELRQVLRVDYAARIAYLSGGIRVIVHPAEAAPGNALVFATGNAAHIAALQARAHARGFGLDLQEEPAAHAARNFTTEGELYAALELEFVAPELRAGKGEVELAAQGKLGELLEVSHLRGMVHCHTTYSDGKNSVLEMAQAAHALGMHYITITDHSPSAHYAGGVTLDRLKQQWDEIAEAAERVPIRILRGTESDILSDGALDYPDAVLESFDVVIASIHARHRLDRGAMTARLMRALTLPIFKIWGHALGRILNHRQPIDCDVPALLDALAGSRGAIELNADPHRLDLPAEWIPAARERGIPFVVSVDAHSVRGLEVFRHGVTQARRGGLSKREVLNTLAADDFARTVRPSP